MVKAPSVIVPTVLVNVPPESADMSRFCQSCPLALPANGFVYQLPIALVMDYEGPVGPSFKFAGFRFPVPDSRIFGFMPLHEFTTFLQPIGIPVASQEIV